MPVASKPLGRKGFRAVAFNTYPAPVFALPHPPHTTPFLCRADSPHHELPTANGSPHNNSLSLTARNPRPAKRLPALTTNFLPPKTHPLQRFASAPRLIPKLPNRLQPFPHSHSCLSPAPPFALQPRPFPCPKTRSGEFFRTLGSTGSYALPALPESAAVTRVEGQGRTPI